MAALALPVAVILGILAEGASFLGGRAIRAGRPVPVGSAGGVAEIGGAAASLLGSSLVAAAVLGLVPGSVALVYLATAMAAAGYRLAAGDDGPWTASRVLEVAATEGALAVAIGTMFLRFGAVELGAARATQEVLGPGVGLEPMPVAVGLGVAALAATFALAMRLAPAEGPTDAPAEDAAEVIESPSADTREEERIETEAAEEAGAETDDETDDEPAPATLLPWVAAWAVAGSTALLVAAFLAGGDVSSLWGGTALRMAAAAAGIAVVTGLLRPLFSRAPGPGRAIVAGLTLLLATAGAVLVATA